MDGAHSEAGQRSVQVRANQRSMRRTCPGRRIGITGASGSALKASSAGARRERLNGEQCGGVKYDDRPIRWSLSYLHSCVHG